MVKFLMFILISSSAMAREGGVGITGGGHGVLCEYAGNPRGTQFRLEVLDLYELRESKSLARPIFKFFVEDYYWTFPYRAVNVLYKRKNAALAHFGANHPLMPAFDRAIALAKTAERWRIPEETFDYGYVRANVALNCSVVQIANRRNREGKEIVSIDKRIVQFLEDEDLAALMLHEALHAQIQESNTITIRDFVALVFSL